jgi:hypothetical protein
MAGNIINAKVGTIALASGDTYTVDLAGDGLINLAASSAMKQQSITNSGTLSAVGGSGNGSVVITAAQASAVMDNLINLDGVIEANSLTASNQSGDLEYGAKFEDSTGGNFTLSAYRNVSVDPASTVNTFTIAPASGKLNVTLDSNDTGSGAGAIYIAPNININSNGGNIILGGGTHPLTGYAVGDNAPGTEAFANLNIYNNGIYLDNAVALNAAGGNITLNGQGYDVQIPYNSNSGITVWQNTANLPNSNIISTSGNGTITLNGVGDVYGAGMQIFNTNIQSANGAIRINATGGTSMVEAGANLFSDNISSTGGAITISASTPNSPFASDSSGYSEALQIGSNRLHFLAQRQYQHHCQ